MGTLTRLHDFETDRDATPPVLISATKMDAELDQLVTESNAQDVRLDSQEAAGNVSTADLADDAVTPTKTAFIDDTLVATDTHIMVADGTDFDNVAVSGDATLANTGALTIATGAITSAKILDATIATGDIALNAIDGTLIADDAINSEHYTDGSIDNVHLADDAVNSDELAAGSVDLAHLSENSVDGSKIVDDAINSEHYTDGSIDSVHLSADCVVSTKVADDSLVNADINSSAAIDATKIHDGSISNTEFGYLNNAASNIQGQIDGITAGVVSTVNDDDFRIRDDGDSSKQIAFQASGISTSTTRTITMPDEDVTLGEGGVVSTAGQVFSNYNAISGNVTTTTTTTENIFLMGLMSVTGTAVWTIAGDGVLTII